MLDACWQRRLANAEGMLRYRVVVEHPDGPLLGELKMKNQRLQELKAAETGPTRSMKKKHMGSRSSKTHSWNPDNSPKFTHVVLFGLIRGLLIECYRWWFSVDQNWHGCGMRCFPRCLCRKLTTRRRGTSERGLPWGIQIDARASKTLYYRNVRCFNYLFMFIWLNAYTHSSARKYLAGKSAMKEDAVPVGKVDLHYLHYYVTLRAFAMTYYIACGFRDWSPNQSRVCSEGWLFVSRSPFVHNRWPWPAIIGSQKCLSQRRWQVFAALWRALLEISHCTHGKQRLGAHFFGKWWWNDSEGNLFQFRTTVIPNFGKFPNSDFKRS